MSGVLRTLVLVGLVFAWCACTLYSQEQKPGTQKPGIWKCSVEVAGRDDHGKLFYWAHGWLEVASEQPLKKQHLILVAVRPSRRQALHDCANYLADRVEEETGEKKKK